MWHDIQPTPSYIERLCITACSVPAGSACEGIARRDDFHEIAIDPVDRTLWRFPVLTMSLSANRTSLRPGMR
jgi:hypothetical protein